MMCIRYGLSQSQFMQAKDLAFSLQILISGKPASSVSSNRSFDLNCISIGHVFVTLPTKGAQPGLLSTSLLSQNFLFSLTKMSVSSDFVVMFQAILMLYSFDTGTGSKRRVFGISATSMMLR